MQIYWFVDLIYLAVIIGAVVLGLLALTVVIAAWRWGWPAGLATGLSSVLVAWAVLETDLMLRAAFWLVYLPEII